MTISQTNLRALQSTDAAVDLLHALRYEAAATPFDRAKFMGPDLPGANDLIERLLQVRVKDFDGRSGWSRFAEARRVLNRAQTVGERRDAAAAVITAGHDLLGPPETRDGEALGSAEVRPEDLRLIAYEVLVES